MKTFINFIDLGLSRKQISLTLVLTLSGLGFIIGISKLIGFYLINAGH